MIVEVLMGEIYGKDYSDTGWGILPVDYPPHDEMTSVGFAKDAETAIAWIVESYGDCDRARIGGVLTLTTKWEEIDNAQKHPAGATYKAKVFRLIKKNTLGFVDNKLYRAIGSAP